ncbi:MAG: ABC transporter ATP-binding protein, partial [Anaerolineae bacterium]|nr:ABC transporter ATP-binding protein [Anaerolineae bacterium]
GEVVGIIGRNGAGKSTLLKILCQITEPTRGRAEIHGRVGSLLEVGTGFHPELTGRENIFMNGAILGMRRSEVVRKFDEIVAFAEIERFLDTPVKRYSSGMYVRLAFAVAAHLEPEILLVDEVLAVGDAQFQRKCLGKMGDVSREGRTVLFVSHNMTAVQGLCQRGIWIASGSVQSSGPVTDVVAHYLGSQASGILRQEWDDRATAPGNEKVRLHLAQISRDTDHLDASVGREINVHTSILLTFEFWNLRPDTHLNLSLNLFTSEGIRVFNSASPAQMYACGLIRGTCRVPGDLLNDGLYRVEIMIVEDEARVIYYHPDVLVFEVADTERETSYHGKWQGIVRPKILWTIESRS